MGASSSKNEKDSKNEGLVVITPAMLSDGETALIQKLADIKLDIVQNVMYNDAKTTLLIVACSNGFEKLSMKIIERYEKEKNCIELLTFTEEKSKKTAYIAACSKLMLPVIMKLTTLIPAKIIQTYVTVPFAVIDIYDGINMDSAIEVLRYVIPKITKDANLLLKNNNNLISYCLNKPWYPKMIFFLIECGVSIHYGYCGYDLPIIYLAKNSHEYAHQVLSECVKNNKMDFTRTPGNQILQSMCEAKLTAAEIKTREELFRLVASKTDVSVCGTALAAALRNGNKVYAKILIYMGAKVTPNAYSQNYELMQYIDLKFLELEVKMSKLNIH